MTHKIFVDDTVVIRRTLEVPERCPGCKRHFNLGDTVFKTITLRPKEEKLRLCTVLDGETKREVVSVKDSTAIVDRTPRQVLEVRCLACDCLIMAAHSRMYDLAEMDRLMAFKLRNLLYDSNAGDDLVQRKCFEETQGYHGACMACNIEADIGDEDVPHPIDPRVHSCLKDSGHVQHESR